MSLESSSAAARYRFHGRTAIGVRLLPIIRLLITAPWGVATVAMLWGLAEWAGLWVVIAVVVIRFLAWFYVLLNIWAVPDELTQRRRAYEFPTISSYDEARLMPLAMLGVAAEDVMRAAGYPKSWLRLALRTRSGDPAGRAYPRRLVSVTISAVDELPPQGLRAVVAHEFGHQLIGGWVTRCLENLCATPLSTVFGSPTRLFIDVLPDRRERISRWELCAVSLAAMSFVVVTAALYPVLGPHFAPVLAAICLLQPFAKTWLGWREEYLADRVCTDLGFGAGFCDHLESLERAARGAFSTTHPASFNRQLRICIRMNELQPARRGGDADGVDFVAGL
ncbi:hypothetical protein [Nocardia sp. NPDC056100]|uniref:hypothetical protein n=1 Tax=Nocardia sp. NPDC056100 TaxID=3345712 RepID=UPI0035DB4893